MERVPVFSVRCVPAFALFLVASAAIGCGGKSGPEKAVVSGKVTLDGAPVETGSIAFIPTGATKGPVAGAVIEQGTYRTSPGGGPVIGAHRVEITAHRPGKGAPAAGAVGATAGPSAAAATPNLEAYIPKQYNKESTLTLDVKSGKNEQDFELKSTP